MKDSKRRIIRLLKMNGGLTTDELSGMLGISGTAVRRHLNTLEAQGLACHRAEQRGMGRPSFVYELTTSATDVFPHSFNTFATSFLKHLIELDGDEKPHELFDRHHERRRQQYITLTKGETLTDRVASLARLMESEGRMTTWQQLNESRYVLREHNCPFGRLNGKFDYPCRCEISLLQKTLKAKVKRINHMLTGDVACVYEIEGQSNGQHNCRPLPRRRWHKQSKLR